LSGSEENKTLQLSSAISQCFSALEVFPIFVIQAESFQLVTRLHN